MYLTEAEEKQYIRSIVESVVRDYIFEKKKKKSKKNSSDKKSKKKTSNDDLKMKSVVTTLKRDDINTAGLMRRLYHPKDKSEEDTYRSLMSKKIRGDRKFTSSEITKLDHMLSEI